MALYTANGRDAVYTFDGDGNAVAWYGSPELLSNPLIPGTKDPNDPNDPGVKLLGGVRAGDAGVVLIEAARRFHLRVRRAVQAEGWWGYNFRTIRGGDGSTLSNHAGGWAIDCASAEYPQGTRVMDSAQRAECAAIEAELEVIRWGGWWGGGSSDEMHFEIREKVADGDITRVANQIRAEAPNEGDEEDMAIVYQNPSGLYVADGAGYRHIGEQATADNLIRAGAKVIGISLAEHQRWIRSLDAEQLPLIVTVEGRGVDADWPGVWALDSSGYHHLGSQATVEAFRARGSDDITISRAEHDEWVRQVGVPA